jgi:hypothetical protein
VLFIGGTGQPKVDELAAWLDGGCNRSLIGCPWLEGSTRYNKAYVRPRVLVKSPPAYNHPSPTNALAERAQALGFDWINAHPTTFPVLPFAGHDTIHFDVTKPPGFRSGGPVTLALTNRFLEQLCGVLSNSAPPPIHDPHACSTCIAA